jgi:hypothetical protein
VHEFLTRFPNLALLPADLTVAVQAATVRRDERWKRRCEPLFRQFRWLYLTDYV